MEWNAGAAQKPGTAGGISFSHNDPGAKRRLGIHIDLAALTRYLLLLSYTLKNTLLTDIDDGCNLRPPHQRSRRCGLTETRGK